MQFADIRISLTTSASTVAPSGTLTLADLETMFETLWNDRHAEPDTIFVSPRTYRWIKLAEEIREWNATHKHYKVMPRKRKRSVRRVQVQQRRIHKGAAE